jgi:hypothetical protein
MQEERERYGEFCGLATQDPQPKIPTKPHNYGLLQTSDKRQHRTGGRARQAHSTARLSGETRKATRGDAARVVVEVGGGITVYPARWAGDRWRAVWYEGGVRRQCQAVSEERLAAKLEKVSGRLGADAPNMERTGRS